MNSKWLKLILVASLAINIAFIATAVYQKVTSSGTIEKKSTASSTNQPPNLQLTGNQKQDLRKIIKDFRMDLLQYKQDILDKRIAIIEAMSDAESSPEEIEKRTSELNELENKLNFTFVEALVQVNNILDSKQRLDFLLGMSKAWFFVPERPRRRHHRSSGYRTQR